MDKSQTDNSGTPKSLLVIGNFLSATGTSRGVCEDLCDRLAAAGWEISSASAKLDRLARFTDMISTVWRCRDRYRCAQVEVYSGIAFIWAEVCCWMLRRLGRPYLLTLHGGNLPVFAKKNAGRVRRLLQSAGAVTAPSPYLLKALLPYRDDIQLVPNALDIDNYPFHLRSNPAPRLVWLRAFHSIYNPKMAIHVFKALLETYPDATLLMAGFDRGDGSLQETQAEAAKLGVADRVEFPGKCAKSEVPARMNRGDIFLNTTNVDNTPVSVIEAMACGLCVVTTNVGGIPDLLTDGEDAILVPPGDVAAMTSAVDRILSDPELACKLSQAARRKTESMAWRVILPRWERMFLSLARTGSVETDRVETAASA